MGFCILGRFSKVAHLLCRIYNAHSRICSLRLLHDVAYIHTCSRRMVFGLRMLHPGFTRWLKPRSLHGRLTREVLPRKPVKEGKSLAWICFFIRICERLISRKFFQSFAQFAFLSGLHMENFRFLSIFSHDTEMFYFEQKSGLKSILNSDKKENLARGSRNTSNIESTKFRI